MSDASDKEEIFAYVPHSRQKHFEALGWEFANDLGPPHCCYASQYVWKREGCPLYPKDDITVLRELVKPADDLCPHGGSNAQHEEPVRQDSPDSCRRV